ncbi:hypothetical protein DER46DRAFT_166605 [Fusarium sp. MPI-SDFR-AT-0072]|nr:hypothetical protein DER46DRAFT_166605 [Fusarium sp. MPI-SDFR-AT-0072]
MFNLLYFILLHLSKTAGLKHFIVLYSVPTRSAIFTSHTHTCLSVAGWLLPHFFASPVVALLPIPHHIPSANPPCPLYLTLPQTSPERIKH